ncbi:MAG: hypothetical protein ACE5HJ_03070 [Thermoplasmata archaeon]
MALSTGAYLALGSAIISGVFSALVFRQFVSRKKIYQLSWGVGLALFTLASTLEFVSELGEWTIPLYKTYFALHPTLVAVLGLGTVYLLANKKVGHVFLAYILIIFAILLFFTVTAEVKVDEFLPGRIVGAKAMPDAVRGLSFLFTIPGAAALIGGAGYSWYKTRWSYNLLIAAGTILLSLGGTLTRLGRADLLYIFLLVGIAVMFVGFLRSLEVSRVPEPEAVPSAAE